MRAIPVPTIEEQTRALQVIHSLMDEGMGEALFKKDEYNMSCIWGWVKSSQTVKEMGLYLSSGCSKIAILDEGNPRWVIKFDLFDRNKSEYCKLELRNYNRAREKKIEEYFAATYYLDAVNAFDFILQERVNMNSDAVEETFIDYVSSGYNVEDFDSEDEYNDAIYNMEEDMTDEDRVYAMLDDERYNVDIGAIINFIEENDINDLHSGNWGYTKDYHCVMVDFSGY